MNKLMKGLKFKLSRVITNFKNKKFDINPKFKNTLKGLKGIIRKVVSILMNRIKEVGIKKLIIWVLTIFIIVSFVIVFLRLHDQATYIGKLEQTVQFMENDYEDRVSVLQNELSDLNNGYTKLSNEHAALLQEKEDLLKKVDELNKSIENYKTKLVQQSNNVQKQSTNSAKSSQSSTSAAPIKATSDERTLLAKIIFAEAGGSTEEDMLLVGNVVMNRVASSSFPNSIYSVIYAKGQYSPTWNGAINKTPSETAYRCADRLLAGERFCPANVVFQAQFTQGSGLWKRVGNHYYCYQ